MAAEHRAPARGSRRARGPRRARALAAAAVVGMLALTGCGAGDEPAPEQPSAPADALHGDVGGAAPAPEEGAEGLGLGDRQDERMAAAAAERAVGFGFVRQRAAAPEEIDAAREDSRARRSDADRTTVQPAACKAPLTALDFSPISLDEGEATRVDVGADTFTGTGTVEVARLTGSGRQEVERHLQTVNALLADCREMTMTVQDGDASVDYRLAVSEAPLSEGTPAQSALVWERSLASADGPQLTAQVLTAVTADAVVMVSFVGQPEAGRKEFTLIAEEMLAAALAAG